MSAFPSSSSASSSFGHNQVGGAPVLKPPLPPSSARQWGAAAAVRGERSGDESNEHDSAGGNILEDNNGHELHMAHTTDTVWSMESGGTLNTVGQSVFNSQSNLLPSQQADAAGSAIPSIQSNSGDVGSGSASYHRIGNQDDVDPIFDLTESRNDSAADASEVMRRGGATGEGNVDDCDNDVVLRGKSQESGMI